MTQHKKTIVTLISLSGLFVTAVILFKIMSQPSLSQLERIKKAGVLTVLTRSAPTTYYEGSNGPAGFEYDLASLFAEHIGVSATFKTPATFSQVLSDIQTGKADIAAAGITITEQRKKHLTFTPPYHEITEQIIYRTGTKRPETTQDLSNGILEVVKGTSHADTLKKLKKIHPKLQWYTNDTLDTDGLLFLINQKLIDFTIADSNQITLIRRFYPQLHVAFDISPPRQLAWALQSSPDQSLYRASVKFFESIIETPNSKYDFNMFYF